MNREQPMDSIENDFAWDCGTAHRQSLEDFTTYLADHPQWWQAQVDARAAAGDAYELTGWLEFTQAAIESAKQAVPDTSVASETTDVYIALKYVVGLINDHKMDWLGQDADLRRMQILRDAMHAVMWVTQGDDNTPESPSY